MSEPAPRPTVDVRVGSATDGLAPVSVAERSLAAGAHEWVGLGLVIGGSGSNLVDRVRLGHVTDFLDLRFWPAFNLADTFIVVGVAVLLVTLVATEREPRRRRVADGSSPGS